MIDSEVVEMCVSGLHSEKYKYRGRYPSTSINLSHSETHTRYSLKSTTCGSPVGPPRQPPVSQLLVQADSRWPPPLTARVFVHTAELISRKQKKRNRSPPGQ